VRNSTKKRHIKIALLFFASEITTKKHRK